MKDNIWQLNKYRYFNLMAYFVGIGKIFDKSPVVSKFRENKFLSKLIHK